LRRIFKNKATKVASHRLLLCQCKFLFRKGEQGIYARPVKIRQIIFLNSGKAVYVAAFLAKYE